jgi:tRNA pseudouridine55 synthase
VTDRSGLVVVDKPAGLTSHDVVARVRRLAGTRKVGHAGTLDPMATGVLLLGVNKATRLLGHLALSEKSYDATVRLGATTVTDDAEGDVLATTPVDGLEVDDAALRAALDAFVGDIEQVPSAVSAVKIAGERAYKRVRAGEQVDLPARPVTIHSLELHRATPVDGFLDVELSVRCSSGTYVRAIARDLGVRLGVGGHLTALRRTAVGGVTLAESTPIEDLEEAGSVPLLPMADAVARFLPTCTVDEAAARDVGFGRPLDLELPSAGPVGVLGEDGELLALYERSGSGARPVAVFV